MTAPPTAFVVISTLGVVSALMSTAFAQAPDQPGAGGTAPTVSSSKILGAQGADEWLASQLRGTAVVGSDNQRIGEVVDDFAFLRADGNSVNLSAFADKVLVLVFLRHLA